jgi:hypothetical protein
LKKALFVKIIRKKIEKFDQKIVWEKSESNNYIPFGDVVKNNHQIAEVKKI